MYNSRSEVTAELLSHKVKYDISWGKVAESLQRSKEWTVAACLGQMKMSQEEATKVADLFNLKSEAIAWLQIPPYKGSSHIPHDPLLYRMHEVRTTTLFISNSCSICRK